MGGSRRDLVDADNGLPERPDAGPRSELATLGHGGLDLVSDVGLRASIAAWPGIINEIAVDQASMVARWERLADISAELGYTELFYLPLPDGEAGERRAREIMMGYAFDPRIRGRVASLGGAISETGEELNYVKLRLGTLRSQVHARLEGS